MQRQTCVAAILAFSLLVQTSVRAEDETKDNQKKIDNAIAKVYPALVQVLVVGSGYYGGREVKYQSAGSGAIISAEGHVITNHHVAGKAKQIRCRLPNHEEISATLVGADALADLAILKLNLSEVKDKNYKLTVAKFGDSDKLKVGSTVMSMGCPAAISQSMTLGVVSNVEMTIPKFYWPFTFKHEGEEVGTLVKWIGHDAVIYPGNSGGPLVNIDGEIVGINEIDIGLGGAIPSSVAKIVTEQLIQHGKPMRSTTGFRCQPLLKDYTGEGVLLAEVQKDSPASRAGLQAGDIIQTWAGKNVTVRYPEQLPDFNRIVFFTPIGTVVKLDVLRAGKQVQCELTTALSEPARGDESELRDWGITARQITDPTARELRRATKDGVYVWSIRQGGPANESKPSIKEEDVILSVNGEMIRDLVHLEEMTQTLLNGKTSPVSVLVAFERKNERLVTVVKLGPTKEGAKGTEPAKPWLGATYQVFSSDLAEALNMKGTRGIRITQVFPGKSAEVAGVKAGDIVTHLDGAVIEASQPEDIQVFDQLIRKYKVGGDAELTLRREPKYEVIKVTLKLAERPKAASDAKSYKDDNFEMEVRDLGYMDRVSERWSEKQGGALVTSVEPGGFAALACLSPGDLVTSIDGKSIENVAAFETRMKKIAVDRSPRIVFFVLRGIHTTYLELEPAWTTKAKK